MWLILVCGALILASGWIGEPFTTISGWTALASGGIALWAILGWIGRWAGFGISYVAHEAIINFRDGYDEARAKYDPTKR